MPRAHRSYDALVADPEVDVVYVATPHSLHAENARSALAHGKHVPVEKAFTVNAAQARAVADSARSRGLLVLEAMWTRFLPHRAFVRSVVASGRLGAQGPNTAVVLGSEGRLDIGSVWYTSAVVTVRDAADETVSPRLTPEDSVAVMATMDEVRRVLGVSYPGE